MPKICIVLSTYNGEKYLPQMLDSLVAQKRAADMIIAIDDGSRDSSPEILRRYAGKLPLQLEILPNNTGHRAAFSTALQSAKKLLSANDLIALADQDDVWLPEKLETLEKAIESTGNSSLVFGDAQVIDKDGNIINPSWRSAAQISKDIPLETRMAGINNITGCLTLFRASLLDKILPIPEAVGVHDSWIGIIAAKNGGITAIDAPVIQYRLHDSNAVGLGKNYNFDETCRRQIAWSSLLVESRQLLELDEKEFRFAQKLKKFWIDRERKPLVLSSMAFLLESRKMMFPARNGRIKKILFSMLGAPAVHLLFGKDK